ncbi:alpha/beta hydrolase (plasmid) [Streptomycetaceae bacterium NBC_01309]
MPRVRLPAGEISYTDSGGDGPCVVLLHGVLMNHSLWREVIPLLREECRCIAPVLPLGGHRTPMSDDADLTLLGIGRIVADFLEALDLQDVVVVGNDWGGVQVLMARGRTARVGKAALVACEAFDNYPPGLPGRALHSAARLPGGLFLVAQILRWAPFQRLPMTFGWMAKRAIPPHVVRAWTQPARANRRIRRDLRSYVLGLPDKRALEQLGRDATRFDKPVLVVWASEDRVMPVEHGRRLAEAFPDARLLPVDDGYTLLPEDQPELLARALADFAHGRPVGDSPARRPASRD